MSSDRSQSWAEFCRLWNEASIQLSGWNSIISLTLATFARLGEVGKNIFKSQYSLKTGKLTEFFSDDSNFNRIYLGNRIDVQRQIPCQIRPVQDDRLLRVFPEAVLEDGMGLHGRPHPSLQVGPPSSGTSSSGASATPEMASGSSNSDSSRTGQIVPNAGAVNNQTNNRQPAQTPTRQPRGQGAGANQGKGTKRKQDRTPAAQGQVEG
ncbi:hypothetical protein F5Y17DRAFT_471239 [Xylariaceae sp. FL0594]|nr:hypothetical protein F5Y17DRAFT_471239 [Xylariaceae sp. FL0594]